MQTLDSCLDLIGSRQQSVCRSVWTLSYRCPVKAFHFYVVSALQFIVFVFYFWLIRAVSSSYVHQQHFRPRSLAFICHFLISKNSAMSRAPPGPYKSFVITPQALPSIFLVQSKQRCQLKIHESYSCCQLRACWFPLIFLAFFFFHSISLSTCFTVSRRVISKYIPCNLSSEGFLVRFG